LQISALLPAVSDTKESGSSKWGKWIDLVPAPSKATRHHSGLSMQSKTADVSAPKDHSIRSPSVSGAVRRSFQLSKQQQGHF